MIPKALGQLLGLLTPVEARLGGALLGIEAALALRIICRLAASASAFLWGRSRMDAPGQYGDRCADGWPDRRLSGWRTAWGHVANGGEDGCAGRSLWDRRRNGVEGSFRNDHRKPMPIRQGVVTEATAGRPGDGWYGGGGNGG